MDTSTALYNVDNTNNPRSVATVNGTSFYLSGQGVKGDDTQGVFVANDGANSATAIDTATDTRTVEIIDGVLYVSTDSTQGAGGTSSVASFGSLPAGAATPTPLSGIDGTLTLTAAQENGINDSAVGTTIHLSPENFFFANATTLYIADGGDPKQGGLGDGGLQKWSLVNGTWTLDYTLSAGLNLVSDAGTSGTTGLIGLTASSKPGARSDSTPRTRPSATSTRPICTPSPDTLAATTLPTDESFSVVVSAAADTNIRGVSLAPSAATTAPVSTVVSAGVTSTGITVTSGGSLTVLSGGTALGFTILSGGSATISASGIDSGTTIGQGGNETVLGSATGDKVEGTQLVNATGAAVSGETVFNGGAIELFQKGETASNITLTNGGVLAINGSSTVTDVVISSGGTLDLESGKGDCRRHADLLRRRHAGGERRRRHGLRAHQRRDLGLRGRRCGRHDRHRRRGESRHVGGQWRHGRDRHQRHGDRDVHLCRGHDVRPGADRRRQRRRGDRVRVAADDERDGAQRHADRPRRERRRDVDRRGRRGDRQCDDPVRRHGGGGRHRHRHTISAGGNETLSGSASGDQVFGTQSVVVSGAIVSDETVMSGGTVDLTIKGTVASGLTVESGGTVNANGNIQVENTIISGGLVICSRPRRL